MDPLGSYISDRRRRKALSRQKLADRCREIAPRLKGFGEASIRFWEGGMRQPSLAQFRVLATALELTPEEIFYALSLAPAEATAA